LETTHSVSVQAKRPDGSDTGHFLQDNLHVAAEYVKPVLIYLYHNTLRWLAIHLHYKGKIQVLGPALSRLGE